MSTKEEETKMPSKKKAKLSTAAPATKSDEATKSDDAGNKLELLQLSSQLLSVILSFLDAPGLSSAQGSCKTLQTVSGSAAWSALDQLQGPTKEGKSDAATPKSRAQRFYKAQVFAERMERLEDSHFDYDCSDLGGRCFYYPFRVNCQGCSALPDLLPKFDKGGERVHQNEFFVRLATRDTGTLITEGFVPATQKGVAVELSLQGLTLNWPELDAYHHEMKDGGYPIPANNDNFTLGRVNLIENLKIVVVAVERQSAQHSCRLVIATGGFHGTGGDHACLMRPRNFQSHSTNHRDDELPWALAVIKMTGNEPKGDHPLLGIDVTTMGYIGNCIVVCAQNI